MPSDTAEAQVETAAPAAAKAKKAPKVEKPFAAAITEDLIPMTLTAFQKRGVDDISLTLDGTVLSGKFDRGRRAFQVVFSEPSLDSIKVFSCSSDGIPSSTVESFMVDERKPAVDLISFYIVQRLYAQQWF